MKILGFFVGLILVGCAVNSNKKSVSDSEFDTYKTNFVSRLWKQYPGWASSVGFHKYDSLLSIPSAESRELEKKFLTDELSQLNELDTSALSNVNQIDYVLIENQLKSGLWGIDTYKSFEWDPSQYNVCGSFAEILNSQHAVLEKRLNAISHRLLTVPSYYSAAKSNLTIPTKEHTQLAIDQNTGGSSVFSAELPEAIQQSELSAIEKDTLLKRCKRAENAVLNYANWLKSAPFKSYRSFRIGEKLYAEKFNFDIQSGFSAKEIYSEALKHKKELHADMVKVSKSIWKKHMGEQIPPKDDLLMVRQ